MPTRERGAAAAVDAPRAERRQPPHDTPSQPAWLRRRIGAVKVVIDLGHEPTPNGQRNSWVVSLSALCFGTLSAAQIRLVDWHTTATTATVRTRVLVVHEVSALVLTPLVVGVFLMLPDLATRLLRRLREDEVIAPAAAGEILPAFARSLEDRLNRVRALMIAPTVLYLAYLLLDTFVKHTSWREVLQVDAQELTLSPPQVVLVVGTLVAQAAVFYLAVTALTELWTSSQAFGRLLWDVPIQVQPLHPDGCGGLRVIGRLLNLVLHVAAVLGAVGICIFLALQGTPWVPTRRPEPYVLAGFYLLLLPSAFTLLWRPHVLMDRRRDQILKPVARAFNAAIPGPTDDAELLRAKSDRLQELSSQLKLLDDACPAWPLRLRRLRPVVVTAVLPIVIPVAVAVASKLLAT